MKRAALLAAAAVAPAMAAASCTGTTGGELLHFTAYASGAPGAAAPFEVAGAGGASYSVQLTAATLYVGAVYLNESEPTSGSYGPTCINPGIYAAEVPGPVIVDLLSTAPQEFSVYGNGTAERALSWEMWLTDGDINAANQAHMVDLEGIATRTDVQPPRAISFGAIVTINADNRGESSANDPAEPGAHPICKERIVQIGQRQVASGGIEGTVPFDLVLFPGGELRVTVDPRAWFARGLDFASLPPVTSASCLLDPGSTYEAPNELAAPAGTCGAIGQPCCAPAGGAPATGTCDPPYACHAGGVCGAATCIPDTNFAAGAGALQGITLLSGIQTGGAAAYSLEYSKASN